MYSKRDNLLFVHIPKTGGQTILVHFLEKYNINWKDRGELFGNKIKVLDREVIGEHLTYQEYLKYNIITNDDMINLNTFSIVRNPYERFLSYYYMRKNKDKFLDLSLETMMKDCSNFLKTKDDELKYSKPYVMIKPQHLYLQNSKNVKVFKYENYNEVEEYLKSFGIKQILKRNVGSKKAKENHKENLKKCIDFVNEYYEKDFETFDYKMI